MVDQMRVVTGEITATGDFDLTHPDITEAFSAAVLIFSGHSTDDANSNHGVLGMGFIAVDAGATTEDECATAHAQNGQNTTPNCGTRHANTASISIGDPTTASAGTAVLLAAYASSQPGGVRLNVSTFAAPTGIKVTALLFAGLSRAYTDDCGSITSGSSEAVGGTTDFTPDLVIFVSSNNAVNTNQNDASPNIGFALNKAGLPQVSAYVNADDATEASDADGYLRSDAAYSHFAGTTRTGMEFSQVTAFTASGFDHTANAGSPDAHYLALKFSGAFRMACANMAVAGSTGLQAFNAFGFTPDVVLGMSTLLGSVDTLIDGPTASCSGYFVAGRHGSRAYTWHHQEGLTLAGATVANAHSRQGDHAVLQLDHTGAVAMQAAWAGGSGSGGFLLDFSTATAGYLTALGIQLIPTPPPGRDHAKAPPQAQGAGRVRRVLTAGVKRAARTGRFLRTLLRNRAAAERARRAPAPELAVTLHLTTDPGKRTGDNAFPGSVKGGNAEAGSIAGDSA